MDEFSFIDSIKQHTYNQSSLVKGIGDDAAVFRQTSQDIVTAVDTFVEGIHFTRQTMPPFYIGYRALAANASDLAAMGAKPAFYLVAITVPKYWTDQELADVFSGMKELAKSYHMDLIGGDTVSGDKLSLSVTIIGYVERGRARLRNHAKEGDIIFVTGTLGDSQAGLHILLTDGNYSDRNYFINRHQKPTPRVDFSLGLREIKRVCLNDISDGIANEAAEIAEASCVDMIFKVDAIPVSKNLHQFTRSLQHEWTYFGGEDFELLGTVARKDFGKVQEVANQTHTRVTKVGYVEQIKGKKSQVFVESTNQRSILKKQGYIHLR